MFRSKKAKAEDLMTSGARGVGTIRPTTATADLLRALGAQATKLRAGQLLEVAVSSHAFNGTVVRWPIASGRTPSPTTLCVPLGNTRPRRRC